MSKTLPLRKFYNAELTTERMENQSLNLNDTDRVWVYQCPRELSQEEEKEILEKGAYFISHWAAHGEKLYGNISIQHHHFIIFNLDQRMAAASGCSLDVKIRWVADLGKSLGMNLLDRMQIAWLDPSGKIRISSTEEFQTLADTNQISPETRVFNNLVSNGAELKQQWLLPAGKSWHSRFFKKA